MVGIEIKIDLSYEILGQSADFVFNIHAANTACQTVLYESLILNQDSLTQIYTDPSTGNRYMRLEASPGLLNLSYRATVELTHHHSDPEHLAEVAISKIPPHVMGYIYPSRYCQSDRFIRLATNEFGQYWQGHSRVMAIQDWVRKRIQITPNSSNSSTSAVDTLIEQVGVCRDFAHLMIALCRAVNIPARFVTGTDYGANPLFGPTDFHAYVEVFIGDRWYIFDPSGTAIPMGLVRFGTGRDAADVAFATIFGHVQSHQPIISTVAIEDVSRNVVLPYHCIDALSTDIG